MTLVRLIFISVIMSLSTLLSAQDLHFSQFTASPLNLNPALTGVMDGDLRVCINGRSQWSQVLRGDAYRIGSVSADLRMQLKNKDFIGIGLLGDIDRDGELSYGTNQGKVAFAYHKKIGQDTSKSNFLIFGAEAGIVRRKTDGLNTNWLSGEELYGNSEILYTDFSAGLLWSSVVGPRKSYYLGLAAHHINQPNISLYSTINESLLIRKTIHGGGEFPLSDELSLLPSFLFLSQWDNQLNFGSSLRNYFGNSSRESSVQFGLFYRTSNQYNRNIDKGAIIFTSRLNIANVVSFGVSYDRTISELRMAGISNDAFELSLGYLFNSDKGGRKMMPEL